MVWVHMVWVHMVWVHMVWVQSARTNVSHIVHLYHV